MAPPSPSAVRGATARFRLGLACWLVQPLYLLLELLVAAGASASYSLRDDTISSLGQLGCSTGGGVCSRGHVALNTDFVVFGLLRGAGAVLLQDRFRPTRWRTAASTLWVTSGICGAAVGLAPVDQHPTLHAWVAAPVFVLQPLAVIATTLAWRQTDLLRGPRWTGLVAGALSVMGALAFGARLGQPTWVGGLERLALWPAYLWLGVVATTLLHSAPHRSPSRAHRDPDSRTKG